jgi:flagellar biosynthesis protein FlhB
MSEFVKNRLLSPVKKLAEHLEQNHMDTEETADLAIDVFMRVIKIFFVLGAGLGVSLTVSVLLLAHVLFNFNLFV